MRLRLINDIMEKSGVMWVKGGDKMLLGEYEHTLDAKGRLAMPAKLRESLGSKFIITKGLDGCLFVYDMDQWHQLEQKLAALPMSRKTARDFTRFLFGGACEGECDKQGRVLLPASSRRSGKGCCDCGRRQQSRNLGCRPLERI